MAAAEVVKIAEQVSVKATELADQAAIVAAKADEVAGQESAAVHMALIA